MATAAVTKPVKGGAFWSWLFWIAIVLCVAVPSSIPFVVGFGVLAVIIWAGTRQKVAPAVMAEIRARQKQLAAASASASASRSAAPVAAPASSPAQGQGMVEVPFVPSRVDTGETFDFAGRGMDARAYIDGVRYGDDGLFEIDLKIIPRGAADYRTTIVTAIPGDRIDAVRPGRTLRMRIDPARPGGPILIL